GASSPPTSRRRPAGSVVRQFGSRSLLRRALLRQAVLREDAGKINGAGWRLALAQNSLQVHQTTGIGRGHELGAGRGHTLSLGSSHGGGDVGELYGKGSAKTAAFLGADHFNQLQPIDLAQKLQRLVAEL